MPAKDTLEERPDMIDIQLQLTDGKFSVISLMPAPPLPMMNLWSQAGAVTSENTTLFACQGRNIKLLKNNCFLK